MARSWPVSGTLEVTRTLYTKEGVEVGPYELEVEVRGRLIPRSRSEPTQVDDVIATLNDRPFALTDEEVSAAEEQIVERETSACL